MKAAAPDGVPRRHPDRHRGYAALRDYAVLADGRTVALALSTSAAVTSAASIERRIAVSADSRSSATQSAALYPSR